MEKVNEKREFDTSLVCIFYIVIVILAKIIRYTILKSSLVNMSIGNGWISALNKGDNKFMISIFRESVASENSKAIFQVFRYLGFSVYSDYEIVITIIWNLIFLGIVLKLKPKLSLFQFMFLIMTVAVLNIWDFCLAKEPLQMIFFVFIFIILTSNSINDSLKYFFSLLIILLSVFTYRNYYIFIILFSLVSYLLLDKFIIKKKDVTFLDVIKVIVILGVVYALVVLFCKYFYPRAYNSFMMFNLRETSANTDLSAIFKSSFLPVIAVDYVILVLRMLIPIELIKLGPQYWLYVFYQILLTIYVVKAMINLKKNDKIKNFALYIYLGFLFASGTFEPDFGSWIRHEAVVAPVFLIIADFYAKKKTWRQKVQEHIKEITKSDEVVSEELVKDEL